MTARDRYGLRVTYEFCAAGELDGSTRPPQVTS
ncbi:hypothetical protein BJ986_000050 [Phycicoccus badiiscoriae]|uniref:Uncharacterized protein n=1 Tax=Pedococcus badiiscoriae TaxID=642776 RepID=A0A852W963_9MICO|nr:hypothetical protein [Pedococcus badiiscoriae]